MYDIKRYMSIDIVHLNNDISQARSTIKEMKIHNITTLDIDKIINDPFTKEYIIYESYYNYLRKCNKSDPSVDYINKCAEIIRLFYKYVGMNNYTIIINDTHYNGTGSFNVAFNYIRYAYYDKTWLWGIFDNDDIIQYVEFNNVRSLIEGKIKLNFPEIYSISGFDIQRTRYELNLLSSNQIPVDAVLYTGTALKDNLCIAVDKSNCNFWSFLFSPIIHKKLSCRLLPMGREDMDMVNTLLYEADESEYVITKIKPKADKDLTYDFKIPNRLIRLNTLVENNMFHIYDYTGQSGSGGYDDMKSLRKYDPTVVEYMNKHKQNATGPNTNVPYNIPDRQHQTFTLNSADAYVMNSDNYGIPNIPITRGGYNIIPSNENTLGELYIATYYVYTAEGEKFVRHMFMNGKNCDDIDNKTVDCFNSLNLDTSELKLLNLEDKNINIDMLKTIFAPLLSNDSDQNLINRWNNIYEKHNRNNDIEVPTHVFGANFFDNSEFITKFTKILCIISFIVICIIVVTLISIISIKYHTLTQITQIHPYNHIIL